MPRLRLLSDSSRSTASEASGIDSQGNHIFDVGFGDVVQVRLDATGWAGGDSVTGSEWSSPDSVALTVPTLTSPVASVLAGVPGDAAPAWVRGFRVLNTLTLDSGRVRRSLVWLRAQNRGFTGEMSGGGAVPEEDTLYRELSFAASDETTALTVDTDLIELPIVSAMTANKIKVSLRDPSTSGDVQVNVRLNGSVMCSPPITLGVGVEIVDVTNLAIIDCPENAIVTVDVVAAGTDAAGLKVAIVGVAVV
jgi:hypothetical protein